MCDHFLLQEAVITQAATFSIDGSLQADYFDPEETENLQPLISEAGIEVEAIYEMQL